MTDDEKDARRYRWLKSQRGLSLDSVAPVRMTRPDGSQYICRYYLAGNGTCYENAETLDEMIDKAMENKC